MKRRDGWFDDAGRPIEKAQGEPRLAALTADLTLTLLALECESALVAGIHERAAFEAAGRNGPPPFAEAGSEAAPDWRALAAQRPSHVFYHPARNPGDARERIERLGARAVAVGPRDPVGNLSALETLGRLLDRPEAADVLIRRLEAEIARARMRHLRRPAITSIYLARAEPLSTVAADSYPERMLALAGFASHPGGGGARPATTAADGRPDRIWLRPLDHHPFAAGEVAVVLCSRHGGFRRSELPALARRWRIDETRVRLLELDWPERDGVLAIEAVAELSALHARIESGDPLLGGGPRLTGPRDTARP